MLKWLAYIVLVSIILVPIAIIDGVIGRISHNGWEFLVRMLVLFLALKIITFIPPPRKK